MIAFRDNPIAFGPFRVAAASLVAMTTLSRLVKSFNALPTISSLPPFEYTLAVPKKLIPASIASRINDRLASSSSDQAGWPRKESPKPCSRYKWGRRQDRCDWFSVLIFPQSRLQVDKSMVRKTDMSREELRADARANNDRILDLAREAFIADPAASLNSIAKAAGSARAHSIGTSRHANL